MSNLRGTKRIDLLLRIIAAASQRERIRLLILAGASFDPFRPLVDELGLRDNVIVREDAAVVEDFSRRPMPASTLRRTRASASAFLKRYFSQSRSSRFASVAFPKSLGDAG